MADASVLIVGGGHNGLVCAHYLARAGRQVTVLERHSQVGGAAVTEELAPGFRASTASYLISLLDPVVEKEMELARHGYRVLSREPASFTPQLAGPGLMLGRDAASNRLEISRYSVRDAEAYPRYEAFLSRIAEVLEPLLTEAPADLLPLPRSWRALRWRERWQQLLRSRRLYRALKSLGNDLPAATALLSTSARDFLDQWFESDVLKGTLATDGVIGTFQPPSAPGTAYVLLHHVMGSAGGARGVWGYVEGGMGALTAAMAASAQAAGAEIQTQATVTEILMEAGRAVGVRLQDGRILRADCVVSNADARTTFRQLLPDGALPPAFSAAVDRIDYASASFKINLALDALPDFLSRPGAAAVGPQHRGTIHLNALPEEIEEAYADARRGIPSRRPVIEMTLPTSVDRTLAPAGKHIANLFVQYAPYTLAAGDWEGQREVFAQRCIDEVTRYAPNFKAAVLHCQALSPPDLERRFALTGGNIFQGALSTHQLYSFRPVPGWSDYRTPVPGLYLCGAAAHPGGGVTGLPGRNAAREILRD